MIYSDALSTDWTKGFSPETLHGINTFRVYVPNIKFILCSGNRFVFSRQCGRNVQYFVIFVALINSEFRCILNIPGVTEIMLLILTM